MKTIEFKNDKGEDMKTTLPSKIMDRIFDMVSMELFENKIFFVISDEYKFITKESDVHKVFEAQRKATLQLISEGVITPDMIEKDIKTNF